MLALGKTCSCALASLGRFTRVGARSRVQLFVPKSKDEKDRYRGGGAVNPQTSIVIVTTPLYESEAQTEQGLHSPGYKYVHIDNVIFQLLVL